MNRLLTLLLAVTLTAERSWAEELALLQGKWVLNQIEEHSTVNGQVQRRSTAMNSLELTVARNTCLLSEAGQPPRQFEFELERRTAAKVTGAFITCCFKYRESATAAWQTCLCLVDTDGEGLTLCLQRQRAFLPSAGRPIGADADLTLHLLRPRGCQVALSRHSTKSLEGVWHLVAVTVHGQEMPELGTAKWPNARLEFKAGRMTCHCADVDWSMPYEVQGGYEWGCLCLGGRDLCPARLTHHGEVLEVDVAALSNIDPTSGQPVGNFSVPQRDSGVHLVFLRQAF